MNQRCPQCNKNSTVSSARLVQDSCGHKKCRICLVQDEFNCRLCLLQAIASEDDNFDNHTTVITQNKFKMPSVDDSVKPVHPNKKRNYKFIAIPNHITAEPGNPTVYNCTICKKSFRTKTHIRYHNYCTGGIEEKSLRCDTCYKEFMSKYHLQTHLMVHLEKKKHKCNVCDKTFNHNSKLMYHKLIHSDIRRYVCQQCGKMFKTKDYLHRHNIIHNGEKPFGCKICGTKFNDASNLKKHQNVHMKDKAHMCDECGKRFKSKLSLNFHTHTHTRLRPYKCLVCCKAFFNKKELHRHQLIHLDIKAYECSICGTSFRRKDNLQRHSRNSHPGIKPTVVKKHIRQKDVKVSSLEKPQENPNAINVITAPPTPPPPPVSPPIKIEISEPVGKPVSVINAPLKLAFKTTAFTSNYNIHSREYVEQPRIQSKPYDYEESVSICKKILQPAELPPAAIIKTLGNVSEKDSHEICHKILAPIIPLVMPDRSHSIRNIKFKLPEKHVNLSKKNILNDVNVIKNVETSDIKLENSNSHYAELKPVVPYGATSVIVNTNSAHPQNEMHWRRRTLQNLGLNLKNSNDG